MTIYCVHLPLRLPHYSISSTVLEMCICGVKQLFTHRCDVIESTRWTNSVFCLFIYIRVVNFTSISDISIWMVLLSLWEHEGWEVVKETVDEAKDCLNKKSIKHTKTHIVFELLSLNIYISLGKCTVNLDILSAARHLQKRFKIFPCISFCFSIHTAHIPTIWHWKMTSATKIFLFARFWDWNPISV